jgi:hypothetical protein
LSAKDIQSGKLVQGVNAQRNSATCDLHRGSVTDVGIEQLNVASGISAAASTRGGSSHLSSA